MNLLEFYKQAETDLWSEKQLKELFHWLDALVKTEDERTFLEQYGCSKDGDVRNIQELVFRKDDEWRREWLVMLDFAIQRNERKWRS